MMATRPLDLVLDRLHGVQENGQGWKARCPAHDDDSPSLSIRLGEDGRVLLHCFAGCAPEAVVVELGLTMADLFAREERRERRLVAETDYQVRDERGVLQGIHRRRDYSDGKKDVLWLTPDGRKGLDGRKLETMPLFGCEDLAGRPAEPVVVCEGEKAAQALREAGYLAVGTVTGASSAPNAEALAILADRDVILWPDADVPGMTHIMGIMRTLGELGGRYRLLTWPGAPEKGDAYDALAMRVDVGALLDAAVAPRFADAQPPLPTRPASRIVLAGNEPITPPEYLIDGVLPKNSLASIVAKEASYKSFAALGMAAAVHTGTPWAGRDAERAPVLYLAAEGQSGIRRRLRAWQIVHGHSLAELMLLPEPVGFLSGDDVERLAAEIAALPHAPALIVVDTLARNFGGGNENAADDMGRFIAACDRLRALTGACILIIHHENKLGGYRGSTAFAGAMDTMIEARREGTAVTLTCKKQKDDGEFEPIHLAARVVDLGVEDRHGRPVSSIVLQPTDVAFVLRQREQAAGETVLSKNEQIALDALNALRDRKASFSEWLRATGLARNSFDRARQSLIEKGKVRNLGGGYSADSHPQVTPVSPPNQSPPVPHPYTVGLGVTAGPPWADADTHLPEELDERHLREEDPDALPF